MQLDWNQVYTWLKGVNSLRQLLGTGPSGASSGRSRS
jgi:hypothetical protein